MRGAEFADMVLDFATDEEKLDEEKLDDTVSLIFDATVSDWQYSQLGGEVCKLVIEGGSSKSASHDEACSLFKHKLINRFQAEFKKMKAIRDKSIESWLGIFAFICEVYTIIKAGGKPIKVIGKAIIKYTQIMLEDSDTLDDEIYCICSKLKICGKMLEEDAPELFANTMATLRRQIIFKNCSCVRRCYVLELIELKNSQWTDPTGSLDRFYLDAGADAAVQDESMQDTSREF